MSNPTDLKARLDAMARERFTPMPYDSPSIPWMSAHKAVALDLLSKLDAADKVIAANNLEGLRGLMEWALEKAKAADAAEAQVKALAEVCKPFIPPMPAPDAKCHVGLVPQEDCAFCNRVKAARAALKLGGE